jgi:ferredoxin
MPVVNFVNEKKQVQCPEGANLRKVAKEAGIQLYPMPAKYVNCMGMGTCGTCRVLVTKGMANAAPMGLREKVRMKFSFAFIGNEDTMRLACQTTVNGDMDVQTQPPMNLFGDSFFS